MSFSAVPLTPTDSMIIDDPRQPVTPVSAQPVHAPPTTPTVHGWLDGVYAHHQSYFQPQPAPFYGAPEQESSTLAPMQQHPSLLYGGSRSGFETVPPTLPSIHQHHPTLFDASRIATEEPFRLTMPYGGARLDHQVPPRDPPLANNPFWSGLRIYTS